MHNSEYTQNHGAVPFKWMNYMAGALHINKTVKEKEHWRARVRQVLQSSSGCNGPWSKEDKNRKKRDSVLAPRAAGCSPGSSRTPISLLQREPGPGLHSQNPATGTFRGSVSPCRPGPDEECLDYGDFQTLLSLPETPLPHPPKIWFNEPGAPHFQEVPRMLYVQPELRPAVLLGEPAKQQGRAGGSWATWQRALPLQEAPACVLLLHVLQQPSTCTGLCATAAAGGGHHEPSI